MRNLYEKKPVLFAILWIVIYVVVMGTIRGRFGDDSLQMLLGLVAVSSVLLLVIRRLDIQKELGMTRWLQNGKALLWLLPMWVLSTGNLWGGAGLRYEPSTPSWRSCPSCWWAWRRRSSSGASCSTA